MKNNISIAYFSMGISLNREAYIEIMRNTIAINGFFFNTERMISQYVTKGYFR